MAMLCPYKICPHFSRPRGPKVCWGSGRGVLWVGVLTLSVGFGFAVFLVLLVRELLLRGHIAQPPVMGLRPCTPSS